MLINCLAVGAGGFIGSIMRYLIGMVSFLQKGSIPFQTLLANVLGAILIGVILQVASSYNILSGPMVLFLKVGICGGFTTFSTFSSEALGFLESGRNTLFIVYVLASLILCVAGVSIGKSLVR